MFARRLALGLMVAGVTPGDRVVVALPRGSAQTVLLLYTVAKLGAVVVPVPPGAEAYGGLAAVCRQLTASVLVTTGAAQETSDAVALHLRVGTPEWRGLLDRGGRSDHLALDARMAGVALDDVLLLSAVERPGTAVRYVAWSHHALLNNGWLTWTGAGLGERERVLVSVDMSRSYGMSMGVLGPMSHAACVVLGAGDAGALVAAGDREACTGERPVPRGTPGELLVRGHGVALGDWDRGTLGPGPATRWVGTGLTATVDPDGRIDVHGPACGSPEVPAVLDVRERLTTRVPG
ncbi:MAG: AMP-binding protein [Actinomycetota bacterium]|nr:AMP-binding protein [Actinomycetota bacterium]